MKQKKVFDSFALLAYLNQEAGFKRVKEYLALAHKDGGQILMNEINLGETYYILSRKRGPEKADYFLERVLPGLPIVLIHNPFEYVIDAARMKAQYPLSFSDCFSAITAQHNNAALITGDPEFKNIEHIITVEWL